MGVPQDLKDLKASKAPRESVVHLALVPVAPLVPWDPKESVVKWASKAPRATPVSKAPRETRVMSASAVQMVPLAWVVLLVLRELLASVDPRVTEATVACVDPKAFVARRVTPVLVARV